ncbi:mannose-6-phosphate isomerase [Paragonimus westermani]|uniref:mannose-6-phosphate isomerase n=1 Tax=Paragonimus westermani TaxID=34504 RepID=A0A5J4NC47_9TREM|nr:mannose-6-phosphate isomerase [Paragonimus westermani]
MRSSLFSLPPPKEHAQLLHARRPDLYKDANHKPELAIALTPFEALLGFRSPKHIASFVQGEPMGCVPELLEVVGNECLSDLVSVSQLVEDEDNASIAIKAAYQKLMRTDEQKVACLVNQLRDRLLQGEQLQFSVPDNINLSELADVFIRLSTQFPGDVGCFSLFFLNYIKLETGQAVFLEANLPHAYLSGDCVECMACSDNVVRAGLTPKYKDVDCLLSMLQYDPRTADDLIFPGESRPVELPAAGPWLSDTEITSRLPTPQVTRFAPPVEDFAVDKLLIPPSCRAFELLALPCASILVFITGSGFLQHIPPKLANDTAEKQSVSINTNSSGFPVDAQAAGRVHQVL